MKSSAQSIGDVAAEVGVEAHVLRHWDAVGVVVPSRDAAGRRLYTASDAVRLRIVRACQDLGMSLPEIRSILADPRTVRREVIERRLQRIEEQKAQLEAAEDFLRHVVDCHATDVSRCDGWRLFAGLPTTGHADGARPVVA